jgi:hypothetical protein
VSTQKRALIVGALVALAAIVIGVVLLADSDDTSKPDTTTTTTEATTTSTTQPPTTTTTAAAQPAGFATPEDAIRDYIEGQGHEYAGDCASTSLEEDVGKWCSGQSADNGDTRTYYIGPTFSEGAEQLTVTRSSTSAGDRWSVTAHEPVPPVGEGI